MSQVAGAWAVVHEGAEDDAATAAACVCLWLWCHAEHVLPVVPDGRRQRWRTFCAGWRPRGATLLVAVSLPEAGMMPTDWDLRANGGMPF
jgi:hypothetical protein